MDPMDRVDFMDKGRPYLQSIGSMLSTRSTPAHSVN